MHTITQSATMADFFNIDINTKSDIMVIRK